MNVSFLLWDMDEIIMWSLLSNMHLLLLRTRLKKKVGDNYERYRSRVSTFMRVFVH